MPILRRPAPSGSYCSGCDSYGCSHSQAAGSSTPPGVVTLQSLLAGLVVALLVPLAMVLSVGSAHAAPSDSEGYRSGYGGTGVVKYRMVGGGDCEGPALYVTNSARQNSAVRGMGPAGHGWVCVNWDRYNDNPPGAVWTGTTGTRKGEPVG